MATGAVGGDGILRGIFDGCISGSDMGIQRRPYHKNCNCALHKSMGKCSHASKYNNVSYPIRRTGSEGCISLMAAAAAANQSPGSSPAGLGSVPESRRSTQLVLCKEEED